MEGIALNRLFVPSRLAWSCSELIMNGNGSLTISETRRKRVRKTKALAASPKAIAHGSLNLRPFSPIFRPLAPSPAPKHCSSQRVGFGIKNIASGD